MANKNEDIKDDKEIVCLLYDVDKSEIQKRLEENNLNILSIAELNREFKNLKESCCICVYYENKAIYNNETFIYWLSNSNLNDIEEFLKLQHISYQILCEAKYNLKGNCPTLANQRAIEKKIKDNLLNYIEDMFTDNKILHQYVFLISMDQNGWIPIEVLEDKLNDAITINTPEIILCINQSKILEIDETEKFFRKRDPSLPYDDEKYRQVVIYDILGRYNSQQDLVYNLDCSDRARVDNFNKDTNSCLMTPVSMEKASRLVQLSGGNYTARFIIPRIKIDPTIGPTKINDLEYLINVIGVLLLGKLEGTIETTRRFIPSELSYKFPENFVPPSDDLIHKIVRQTNYYFSDQNILKDLFLLALVRKNTNQWVDLNAIFAFKKVQALTKSKDVFVYAMCYSDVIQISRNAKLLRRRLPLPPWDGRIYSNMLFAYDFMNYLYKADELYDILVNELHLRVRHVRVVAINHHMPHDLKRLIGKIKPWRESLDIGVAVIELYNLNNLGDLIKNIQRRFNKQKINCHTLEEVDINDLRLMKPPRNDLTDNTRKELRPPVYIHPSGLTKNIPDFQSGSLNDPAVAKRLLAHKPRSINAENQAPPNLTQSSDEWPQLPLSKPIKNKNNKVTMAEFMRKKDLNNNSKVNKTDINSSSSTSYSKICAKTNSEFTDSKTRDFNQKKNNNSIEKSDSSKSWNQSNSGVNGSTADNNSNQNGDNSNVKSKKNNKKFLKKSTIESSKKDNHEKEKENKPEIIKNKSKDLKEIVEKNPIKKKRQKRYSKQKKTSNVTEVNAEEIVISNSDGNNNQTEAGITNKNDKTYDQIEKTIDKCDNNVKAGPETNGDTKTNAEILKEDKENRPLSNGDASKHLQIHENEPDKRRTNENVKTQTKKKIMKLLNEA